jgi:hypothetical protein
MRETSFRLSELLNVCQASRRRFLAKESQVTNDGRLVNFHFSAFSSLVQTIKDILPVVADQRVTWSDLSNVRHMQFMRAIRNAITHDGNPVINLWTDGRFYVACDFLRLDQNQQQVRVQAPTEDVETLAIQFTTDLCSHLRCAVSPLVGNDALTGPLYGAEFFDNAMNHPAVPAFAQRLYAEVDRPALERSDGDPVAEALSELDALLSFCRSNSEGVPNGT